MFLDILRRFQVLDSLIQTSQTGTPTQLAKKLKVSERTLYQYIRHMRAMGAPIAFDDTEKTYLYTQKGTFKSEFFFDAKENKNDKKKESVRIIKMKEFIQMNDNRSTLN